jgi:hypothetical protein
VYRRFKTLEAGSGPGGAARKAEPKPQAPARQVPAPEASAAQPEHGRRGSTGEISQLYKDLQEGAPHLQGAEQEKAYRMLEQMQAGMRTPQQGTGTEKLSKIGSDLEDLSRRLEGFD